jgi:uncharacterized protein YlxW (UPF0749 family)
MTEQQPPEPRPPEQQPPEPERPTTGEPPVPGPFLFEGPQAPDPAGPDPAASPHPAATPKQAWHRLLRAGAPRATRANVLAMVLAAALGFAIIVQVRQTSDEGLDSLREDELVRIFAGVDREGERLADEIRGLQSSLDLLKSQSSNDAEAQRAARERLAALGILAGTVPATGPGIVLTISDPQDKVDAPIVLDTVQELRDAGAEAIQINDVRVVADTWFADVDGGLSVSGTQVSPPYVIKAIGDANTLAGAMEIPGGVTATVRRVGGDTDVQIEDEVVIDALLTPASPQYARPVPTPTP